MNRENINLASLSAFLGFILGIAVCVYFNGVPH
jgi:hypothetical protein